MSIVKIELNWIDLLLPVKIIAYTFSFIVQLNFIYSSFWYSLIIFIYYSMDSKAVFV